MDDIGLERLPLHARAEQVMMVTGGAGSGKSRLVDSLELEKPGIYQNAVQINPDDYKDLLANKIALGEQHASFTHWESSMIADTIMERLDDRMAQGLPAPHVLMDVTAPHENRMQFAMRFDQMTVMHGTAPPEETVQRVYDRGFDADGAVKGRVLPTEIALSSTSNSSRLITNVFSHPNLEFTMLNMDVPKTEAPTIVAEWDNDTRRLSVYEPDTFLDFVERQNIDTSATSPEQLFEGVERGPEKLAQNLQAYTDKGVTIETASNLGSLGGMAAGAAAGAALGSVVPIVGTAVGGVVGGVVGAVGGGVVIGEATEFVYDHADDIADWLDGSDDKLLARLRGLLLAKMRRQNCSTWSRLRECWWTLKTSAKLWVMMAGSLMMDWTASVTHSINK